MFKTIRRITNWAKAYKVRLYLGYLCSFFSALCVAGPVMLAAYSLQALLKDSRGEITLTHKFIWENLLTMILLILLRFLFTYGKNRLQESIGYEVAAGTRIKIGDILKRVSLSFFAKRNIGDILQAMTTELSTLELQGTKMIDSIVNGYIQVIATLICIAVFSPLTALIGAGGVILSYLALGDINKQSKQTAKPRHQAQEDMAGAAIEYIRGLPVVKSFGQEGASINRFWQATKSCKEIFIKNELGFVKGNCLHLFFLRASSLLMLMETAWETYIGKQDIFIFLMICMFSFSIFKGVEVMNDAVHVLAVIDEVMDKLEHVENAPFIDETGKEITLKNHDIAFEHVSFGYDKQEILHDITFNMPENTTTAIVGPSGSGKSTICNLMARFYDVNQGTVKIGGQDIRQLTCDSLLKNISMVFQNVYLFKDTIANNIKFGKPDATDEEMKNAAKSARCHEFIMGLPQGYDTVIGEGGSTLSGGEKQRISIARAILKDAPIVVLDEATASVDPENEHEIQKAITALTHGKTIIIIAHRLATIEQADQILVVDKGTIVQEGTHTQLINEPGIYKHFIEIREQAEGWQIA